MPELNTAYIRHVSQYKGNAKLFESLFSKLMTWAGPKNLLCFPETQCISVYHNDPKEHPEGKCIVDIVVPITAK
jgi:AraC family transcriptional regulator